MSPKKLYGTFPTPYGITIPVFKPEVFDPSDPDRVLFTMEGTAIFAGIHDQDERRRFVADAQRLGGCPQFEDDGGHSVPKVALPIPRHAAYPRVAGMEADVPVEAWTTDILDCSRWCDRGDLLLGIIGNNQEQAAAWADDTLAAEIHPLGIAITMTAALEHLCETEIDCLEAAALYALTTHDEWRRAGIAWLHPFQETWFRDWSTARPHYTAFARSLEVSFELPQWVAGGGRA
ncbi:hypothetical protein [Methylobacterium sp. J-076]|uniref:hypothetical protein n=1 Tax=Methylobacterium sp. J-076 TaxID=2836655 RepID=UPI001FBB3AB5|nr:hypothetical protein [Methylobacterium sp. J-076]MCJ2013634.1 hypothetical protein [Methylobacterium sp. J-076]